MTPEIDLGSDHYLRFFAWQPDDLAANREQYGTPLPNVERAGAIIRHRRPDGEWCESAIHFDIPNMLLARFNDHVWRVEAWEPLTLAPSLLCRACDDHGFICAGKWVPA